VASISCAIAIQRGVAGLPRAGHGQSVQRWLAIFGDSWFIPVGVGDEYPAVSIQTYAP